MPRQINCPNCGAPLTLESALATFVVCNYCGQSLAVRDNGVDPLGHLARLVDVPSRLAVGASGKIIGQGFRTLGRLRYQHSEGYWDEWFLQLDNQRVGWLEEDEGELTLVFKTKLTTPVPPFEQIRAGSFIPLGADRLFVSEKGEAQLAGAEGEVASAAPPGRPIRYVDGNAGGKVFRLVLDEEGITLHTGQPLQFDDVAVD